jgi:hypothetical protein
MVLRSISDTAFVVVDSFNRLVALDIFFSHPASAML